MFAFVVVFFSLLTSPHPCTTALGMCRTMCAARHHRRSVRVPSIRARIWLSLGRRPTSWSACGGAARRSSCACGNVIPEGYVFMFATLLLTSATLVQRFSRMVQHHRVQHRLAKPTLILGSLLLTLTGIFPERYDQNGQMGGYLSTLYGLHLLGVFGSGTLLLGVPFLWFAEHWWTHRASVPLRSLLCRLLFFAATASFGTAFVLLSSNSIVTDQVAAALLPFLPHAGRGACARTATHECPPTPRWEGRMRTHSHP